MIVELAGSPCSGKSSLLRALEKSYKDCEERGRQSTQVVLFPKNNVKNKLQYGLIYLISGLIRSELILLTDELCKSMNIPESSVIGRFRVRYSIFRKLYTYRKFKSHNNAVVVLDEGTIQILFNLFAGIESISARENIELSLGMLPLPDKVVFLSADFHTLLDRMEKRGHWRLKNNNNEKARENLIKNSNLVSSVIREHSQIELTEHSNDSKQDIKRVCNMLINGFKDSSCLN